MATKNYAKGVAGFNRENNFGTTETNWLINVEEFTTWLKTLPKDAKGSVRVTSSPQKDETKSSMFENTYVPKSGGKKEDDSDSLPF